MVGAGSPLLLMFLISTLSFFSETEFEVVNKCSYTINPGVLSTDTVNWPLSVESSKSGRKKRVWTKHKRIRYSLHRKLSNEIAPTAAETPSALTAQAQGEAPTPTPESEPIPPVSDGDYEPVPPNQVGSINFIALIIGLIISAVFIIGLAVKLCTRRRKIQQGIHNITLEDGRYFTYSKLVKITKNFASSIGAGGFGEVYHGIMENGDEVAVKVLKSASGSNEFQNEVKLLMRAHHKNVVSFTGYCNDGKNMALVFKYLANGNLQQHLLSSATGNVLTWKERLQIAVDAAHGLDYLHNDCKPPIIHRDIKPSNILLTEKMRAKICDFGVSKLLSNESGTHTMTDHVRGTRGYYDPQYYYTGMLNKKSDIYSFGVVLLELITGRTAITQDAELEPVHISNWSSPIFKRGDIEAILDSRIAGTCNVASARKAVEIAMKCVSSTAIERPDINAVYKELKECLKIEVPPEMQMAAEIVESESDDCSSTSSSVPVRTTSHTRSESFLLHTKIRIEYETDRHSC